MGGHRKFPTYGVPSKWDFYHQTRYPQKMSPEEKKQWKIELNLYAFCEENGLAYHWNGKKFVLRIRKPGERVKSLPKS